MSYADAMLDLTSLGVACLSGPNGAGKSALLDAVTWAIWEGGRSSSDELIRLGEREMWVDLCFAHEGQRYRVRRSRYRSSGRNGVKSVSKGTLEFQVWNGSQTAEPAQQIGTGLADGGSQAADAGFNDDAAAIGDTVATAAGIGVHEVCDAQAAGAGRASNPLAARPSGALRAAAAAEASSAPLAGASGTSIAVVSPSGQSVEVTPRKRSRRAHEPVPSTDGVWRSLTAASMKETQKLIENLLRMDFDTFVNSAYLRQGRADEFTTRNAMERKQVLCEILGLSYFDRLQEQARDKVRELKARQEWLQAAIASLGSAELEIGAAENDVEQNRKNFERASEELDACKSNAEELQQKIQRLQITSEKVASAEKQVRALCEDIETLSQREIEVEQRRASLAALVSLSPEIEQAVREFERVKAAVEQLDLKAVTAQDMMARRLELQTHLARQRSKIELELEHVATLRRDNEDKQKKLLKDTADAEKIEEAHRNYKETARLEAELSKRQELFVQLTQRANSLQSQIVECRIRLEAEAGQKEVAVSDFETILSTKNSLESQRFSLQNDAENLEKSETEFELVEERGLSIKSRLESAQIKIEELRRRQRENKEKIQELTCHDDSGICPLCASPIVDRAAVIDKYKRENESFDSEIADLKHEIAELEVERGQLRKEYLALKQKLEMRKALDTQIGQFNERISAIARAEESCQKVRAEHQALVRSLQDQEYAVIERESLVAVKAEIHKLEFDPVQFSAIQAQLRAQRHVEVKFQQLQRDLSELKRLIEQLPDLESKDEALSAELAAETYGMQTRNELHGLQQTLSELNYDRQRHAELKVELAALMPKTEQFRELQKASAELPAVVESLAGCRALLATKREALPLLRQELENWQIELKALPDTQLILDGLRPSLVLLAQEKEQLARTLAVSETLLEQLRHRLAELIQAKTELTAISEESDDYAFLAEAFGKKGIQAVIIENAIPEIEAESNRILSRLTENKMHVALVTQQRTKSGGITETLDLLIGDETGTRNYELYSGGEAFKVNFAIRVALSRLLARRSGAKLETLIIDEGFGSQDDLSRERLVKAIRSIQSDFARILVITHLPDVREMFPNQIQVKKIHGASQFNLLS
jgi:exonuclease SbcC